MERSETGLPAVVRGKIPFRFWVLAAAGVLLLMVPGHIPIKEGLLASRDWFSVHPVSGPVLYYLGFVAAALFFFPTSWLMIGAGLMFGWTVGAVISSLGCTLAAALSFLLMRHTHARWLRERLSHNRYFHSIDHAVEERGALIVGLLRLSPLHFGLSNCLYSLTPVRFWPYVLASWIGLIPGTLMFAYLGHVSGPLLLAGGYRTISLWEWISLGVSVAVTTAVSIYLSRRARRYLRRRGVAVPAEEHARELLT
jgi:uncharacterized membrane protein YdjX (TVP38/TMEM64 family)